MLLLLSATGLILAMSAAHSYLGEKYILRRLFRQTLPPLFGDDSFTKQTLRFVWHLMSVMGIGLAALLVLLATNLANMANLLYLMAGLFGVMALFPLLMTRARHLSWLVMLAIALLCGLAATVDL